MEFNSLDKILNKKKENLNLLKNKFSIRDLNNKIDNINRLITN